MRRTWHVGVARQTGQNGNSRKHALSLSSSRLVLTVEQSTLIKSPG